MPDGPTSGAALAAATEQMAAVLHGEVGMDAILHLVVSLAPGCIQPADAASVSLVREGPRFETSNATSDEVVYIDRVQYATRQGPCITAIEVGETTVFDAGAPPETWPDFTRATNDSGVTSVLALPLIVRGRTLGVLNLYSHLPGAADRWDRDTATVFTTHAAVVLANAAAFADAARTTAQLEEALQTRDTIGQAKGIVMAREGCTADEAFSRLRAMSQKANLKLRDIAVQVAESVGPPPLTSRVDGEEHERRE